jgi:hypothetical protein
VERLVHDAALPPALGLPELRSREQEGVFFTSAVWTPRAMGDLVGHLTATGSRALEELAPGALRRAWSGALAALLDPTSSERRALEASLPRLCGLSPAGTAAALRTVLGGAVGSAAESVFDAAQPTRGGLVTIVLASNLPALVVQPLLPVLALGRPALVKSPSAEPLFAPALVRALVAREPALADAVAAVTWRGGDSELEAPILAGAETVIAYGDDATLADLRGRTHGRLLAYGPRTSLAVIAAEVPPLQVAGDLARDVALFDQRGCLSPQAVYTDGPPEPLAAALARELAAIGRLLPPGPPRVEDLAAVQQARAEAALRGLVVEELAAELGTVIIDPEPRFRPGPGLRTVRVHPVGALEEVPRHLEPWRDRLQGVALAGRAWELAPALRDLGISRCAAPGALQAPDARWHNGGRHPVELLAAST